MTTVKEEREKEKTKRDKMGGYFLNLSQLTFVAVVLGGVPSLFENANSDAILKIILGLLFTIALAWIGFKILK